jgi:WD40 repeat protein/serine/threonine protein kinase
VRPGEIFDHLIRYRNQELAVPSPPVPPEGAASAAGRRNGSFYERVAMSLLAGGSEVLGGLDLLLGRRLVYLSDVRRRSSGSWLVERYELSGELGRQIESVEITDSRAELLPRPGEVVLESRWDPEGTAAPGWISLHPLVRYDPNAGDFFFLTARRGPAKWKYLSYSSGQVVEVGDRGEGEPRAPPTPGSAQADWRKSTGPPDEEVPARPRRTVGEFELVSRIGRGGMGVVYRAWQASLGRQVALKCLLGVGDSKVEARFAREIRSLGRVDHPNLVKIYTSGSDGDQWFYAMELIEGADLGSVINRLCGTRASDVSEDDWGSALSTACLHARRKEESVGERGPGEEAALATPPPMLAAPGTQGPPARTGRGHLRQAVSVVRQAAEATHALHEAGVIHRDIKPGNIMLTADSARAVLMDLGVAQLVDDAEGRLTRTRQFVGTLLYASPEQVLAVGSVDRRSDVYSLGATLWELLALKPLFGANEKTPTPELMLSIQSREPGRVRQWNPRVSPDLEAIVQKCLEKDRVRRYGTARELAEDLARYERGEAVEARPATTTYLLRKHLRRHRWRFAAVAAILLAAILATAGIFLRIASERRAARIALFDMYTANGIKAGDSGNPAQAVLWFSSASGIAAHDTEREEANRVRILTWSREAASPLRALPHPGQSIRKIEFHPSDAYLLTLAQGDRATVWDLKEEKPLRLQGGDRPVRLATFSPGGEEVVLVSPEGVVELFRFPTGERQESPGACGDVRDVAFSPDGRFLAVAAGKVCLFDLLTRRSLQDLEPASPAVLLAFNSRGDRLAAVAMDSGASLFSLSGEGFTRTPVTTTPGLIVANSPPGSPEWQTVPSRPVFVHEDRAFLALSSESELTTWETETGKRINSISSGFSLRLSVISPDGRYLALVGPNSVGLWDLANAALLGPPLDHVNVASAAFSPDGAYLLTYGWDRRALLWSLFDKAPATGSGARSEARLALEMQHSGSVTAGAFGTQGRFFATAHRDGLVRVWGCPQRNPGDHSISEGMLFTRVALSPDGNHLLAIGGQQDTFLVQTRVHQVATGKAAGPVLRAGGLLTGGSFYRDGSRAITLNSQSTSPSQRRTEAFWPAKTPGDVRFWNWRMGKEIFDPLETPSEPWDCAFSPDGKTLVVVCAGGQILLVDPASGKIRRSLDHGASGGDPHIPRAGMVTFSPDGRNFVTSGIGQCARVWNTEGGEHGHPSLEHGATCHVARFSPDGRWLATGCEDGKTVLWDFANGQPSGPILVHPGAVRNISFSPSGDRLLVSSVDVRLWDWKSAKLVCPAIEHRAEVGDASFSGDGRWVITAGRDGIARICDGRTGMPVSPPLPLVDGGWQVVVTPNGERAVVAGDSLRVCLFNLADRLGGRQGGTAGETSREWGQLLSGQRVEGSGIVNLAIPEWLDLWSRYAHGAELDLSPQSIIAWHWLQEVALEEKLDLDAARWHLERLSKMGEEDTRARCLELEAFVRSWRFPRATTGWPDRRAFAFPDADQQMLEKLEAQSISAPLLRSRSSFIDLYVIFPGRSTNAAVYAFRTIDSPVPMKVKVFAGSDDSLRVWVNRLPVLKDLVLQGAMADQDSGMVELQAGNNTVLVEVGNAGGGWGFYFHLEDEYGRRLRLTDEGRLEPIELPR